MARMRVRRIPPWALIALLGCGGVDACGACGGDHVAELVRIEPEVQRDHAAAVGDWKSAAPGAVFDVGDGLRTGPGGSAELKLFPDGAMRVQPNATVRFHDAPPGQDARRLQIEGGEVEIESGGVAFGVDTAFGITRLDRGSRLRVSKQGGTPRLLLLAGAAEIAEADGSTRSLTEGQGLVLEGGLAVIEAVEAEPSGEPQGDDAPMDAAADAAVGAPAADAGLPDGGEPLSEEESRARAEAEARVYGKLDPDPGPPMVNVPAGESATIHDPRPPSRLAVSLQPCPAGGVIEVARRSRFNHFRARGEGSAVVQLGPGRYRYRIRCMEDGKLARRPAARGSLRVVRDSASRKLPTRPPSVTVDADGRRYSVRYSNLLPRLTFRWRRPPNDGPQTLRLRLQGGKKHSVPANSAGARFESGDLPEGTHKFHFEAGGAKSKEGIIDIEFDNRARRVYLSEPAGSGVPRDGKIELAGGALPGSRLSVDGVAIPLGSRGRFSAEVAPPAGRDAIALRLEHRRSGVHYYLRHLAP